MTNLHVRVRVASEDYALSVSDVLEVSDFGEVTPVPGAPSAVLGLRNVRGNVMAVVDLAAILHLAGQPERERIVVAAQGGRQAALAVDSIVGVEELPESAETAESLHLTGAVLIGGSLVGVVDVKSILDHIQQRSPIT